jgi:cytochrome c556
MIRTTGFIVSCLVALPIAIGLAGCSGKDGPKPSADSSAVPPAGQTQSTAPAGQTSPAAVQTPAVPSKTKTIMSRLAGGPQSLGSLLQKELAVEKPEWATIQPQTAEYAKLASELGTVDPPQGSKESWTKQTADFAALAAAFDKAAQAKDSTGAKKAQADIGKACAACHTQHRPIPFGRGMRK